MIYNRTLSGLPHPGWLSDEEWFEYFELIEIVQNIAGIEYIAHNANVMLNPDCATFTARIRDLIYKEPK